MWQGIVKQLVLCNGKERVWTSCVARAHFVITVKSVYSALTCVVGNRNRAVQKGMLCMHCELSNAPECCGFCEG